MAEYEHHPRDTDATASRASPSASLHSSSSSTSSVVPLKKRRLNGFRPYTETTPATPTSPNHHTMESEKNAAASALAALSAIKSSKKDDAELVSTTPSQPTSPESKDNLTEHSSPTIIGKFPAILSKVTDGNASDSDLSSNGSLGSSGPIPMPRAVHAPPVNSMMVDHTYTDYSVLSEEYLALYCGCTAEDGTNGEGISADGGAGNTEEGKKLQARKIKKLKQIFRNMGQTRKNSGGVVQPFPAKLMEVLDRGDMEDSIRWMPHGRAFAVLQPPVFVKEVLPRFFKQSKVTSFTRQLNLWGFKRITKGTDAGAYYHELFLRGRPRLCMMMRRQKIKGTGIKLTPNPDTEPNFYTISEDRPLPPPAKKDTVRPLPPLQPQAGIMSHPNGRRGINQLTKQRSLRLPPHSHILSGTSPSAAASRFTSQTLGANKSHLMALNEARQQQQHGRQYPFPSQHSSHIQGGYNTHASNTSPLLLNRLPVQDPSVSNHHPDLLRSIPDAHNAAAYHHHLNQSDQDLRNQRAQGHYPDRQSVLYHEQRLVAEHQQLRSEQEKMHMSAILRERVAVEKEEQRHRAQQAQHAYLSAQDLLYQVNGMTPESQKAPSASTTSVEELKHRLLVAARALEGAQQPGNGAGVRAPEPMSGMLHGGVAAGHMMGGASAPESLGGMMHGGASVAELMRGGGSVPSLSHQSQLRQMQSMQSQQQRVNFPALMSVLEQTQKVAAAAHEQSAMLQKFAQDLNSDSAGSARGGGQFGGASGFPRY